jgi:hypothetical protein
MCRNYTEASQKPHSFFFQHFFLSLALQSFGPWSLFQFLYPIHSLDGRSARRKAATYTQNIINTE